MHVVTGRSQALIEPWLGALPIWLHAEHGLCSRKPDNTWLPCAHARPAAIDRAEGIMKQYAARTPGAFVETKAAANSIVAYNATTELKDERRRKLDGSVGSLALA